MLKQHTELMDRILTSAKARSIVDQYVTPMYGQSVIGLWLFQVIGAQLDDIDAWIQDFSLQIVPQTATWALDYWEEEFGLPRDPEMSIEKRRLRIESKQRDRGAITPVSLARIASVATANAEVEIEERTGPYKFTVWVSAYPNEADTKKVTEVINRAKPAHLIFDVKYVQHTTGLLYAGGSLQMSYDMTITQV